MAGPAGWFADPYRRHEHRYYDGARWTENVADAGVQVVDHVDAWTPFYPEPSQPVGVPKQPSGYLPWLVGGVAFVFLLVLGVVMLAIVLLIASA